MVENVFGILVSRFRVLLGTMELRPKVIRDIAQYAEDTARQSNVDFFIALNLHHRWTLRRVQVSE